MAFEIIDNPDFKKFKAGAGFKNHEFRLLAGLFSRAAAVRALYDMGVEVDFDEGVCAITYYRTNAYKPFLRFVIRHAGPRTVLYELYAEGRGRIARSGLFQRVYERLAEEIESVMPGT